MTAQPKKITKKPVVVSSLFTAGLALLLFVILDIYNNTGIATLDQPVLEWFMAHRTPWLSALMHSVTTLLSGEALILAAILIAAVWYWRSQERWRPILLVVSFIGAIVGAWLFKLLIARARPLPDAMLSPLEIGYSLPSIHTFGVAIFAATLGYLIYSRKQKSKIFWLWFTLTAGVTAIMATTRLYLGYHWLTDTVASVGLALITLAIIILVDTLWRTKRSQRST